MYNDIEPQPNVPLIRKVWDWVQEQDAKPGEESQWVQNAWFCLPDEHAEYIVDNYLEEQWHDSKSYTRLLNQVAQSCGTAYCIAGYVGYLNGYDFENDDDGDDVSDFARDELGLHNFEADGLFEANNDIDRVRIHLEAIMDRAGDKL